MAKLLATEVIDGRVQRWWLHPDAGIDDNITVETVQDVQPILDRNKEAFNSADKRFGDEEFHKVADIPITVMEDICRVKKMPMRELIAGKTDRAGAIWDDLINGRDWRHFRTRPGVIDMKKR